MMTPLEVELNKRLQIIHGLVQDLLFETCNEDDDDDLAAAYNDAIQDLEDHVVEVLDMVNDNEE